MKFFISYAHGEADDERLCTRLAEALAAAGHDVFFDRRIKLGDKWAEEIERHLEACDSFVLLLSENALKSEMVLEEVNRARSRCKAGGAPRIFTVRVKHEGKLPYDWAAYLSSYQWRLWRSEADTAGILEAILDAEKPPDAVPGPTAGAEEDFTRPSPSVDFSSLKAPGGALPPEDPFYISRSVDRDVLDAADRVGETVVIKAPRQMGKSSLLKRYLLRCRKAGKRTGLVDLSIFSDDDLKDYSTFLTCLAADMQEKLGLGLDERPRIQSQPDMTYFVQNKLLGAIQEPVVLAFDEVDRVLGQPYQANFFSMLRYWHERRTDPGQEQMGWPRLDLALIISTEPYLLVDEAIRSPFNVRAPVELRCFTKAECGVLNERYRRMLPEPDVGRLYELLGGQPYLTRLAYYRLGRGGLNAGELERTAHEDGGPFGDHLGSLLRKLRKQNLLAAMKQVIAYGTVPAEVYERLAGAGLVRKEAGRILPANQLYQSFFKAAS